MRNPISNRDHVGRVLDGSASTVIGKILKIPDLGSADIQKQSNDELNRIVTKGKDKMPAFDGRIKKDQVDDLVAYIRTFGSGLL
jgi:hypothetical protein